MIMTDGLIGRKTEYERLNRCMQSTQAQLIIVYGRRRVGKTFLIHQFFNDRFTFQLTGAYEQPRNVQLRNFAYELKQMTAQKSRIVSVIRPPSCCLQQIKNSTRENLFRFHEAHFLLSLFP